MTVLDANAPVNARPEPPRPRALSADRSPIFIRMAIDMPILISDFFYTTRKADLETISETRAPRAARKTALEPARRVDEN